LKHDPTEIFRAATRSATDRARSLAAELRVSLSGIDLSAEIAVDVQGTVEETTAAGRHASTRIPIHWRAAKHPGLFPSMNAVLSVYPLTATETQLDFDGEYEPPFGILGGAIDAILLHRVAEASVHRFVSDVAHCIRRQLS
jgi:hypothetical protein